MKYLRSLHILAATLGLFAFTFVSTVNAAELSAAKKTAIALAVQNNSGNAANLKAAIATLTSGADAETQALIAMELANQASSLASSNPAAAAVLASAAGSIAAQDSVVMSSPVLAAQVASSVASVAANTAVQSAAPVEVANAVVAATAIANHGSVTGNTTATAAATSVAGNVASVVNALSSNPNTDNIANAVNQATQSGTLVGNQGVDRVASNNTDTPSTGNNNQGNRSGD